MRRIQEFTGIRKDRADDAIDINDVVKNAVDITRTKWKNESEASGVQVEVRTDLGDISPTAGNAYELTQVVSNLIFNAVEAMPTGGELTLETSREGDWIRLDVSDTGTGMSEDVRSRAFDPFFTTKETGSGLGLSVVHGIVSRQGGKITVVSEARKGSTFSVRLPIIPLPLSQQERQKEPAENHQVKRILIIEDDDLSRKLLKKALSMNGHRIEEAPEGAEGLSKFKADSFDLVITDLSMPGMSGWEVAKGVKEQNPEVPVVLLSGWAVQHEREKLKEAGIDYVISKPCSLDTLHETVDKALRERTGVEG